MFIEESGKSYIWGCTIERLMDKLMVPHATVFVPNTVYAKRKYDQSFRISGDFDFLLSCYLHGEQFMLLPRVIARVKRGGLSDTQAELVEQELREIARKRGVALFPESEPCRDGGEEQAPRFLSEAIAQVSLAWRPQVEGHREEDRVKGAGILGPMTGRLEKPRRDLIFLIILQAVAGVLFLAWVFLRPNDAIWRAFFIWEVVVNACAFIWLVIFAGFANVFHLVLALIACAIWDFASVDSAGR